MRRTSLLSVVVSAVLAAEACSDAKASQSDAVMPLAVPQSGKAELAEVQQRLYRAAQRQAHYLLGTVHPWKEDPRLLLLTESRSSEHWIRPNTSAIQGFAFLYRFGPYDEKMVGVARSRLLSETIVPMMRYVVATHATGSRPTSDGKKWGNAWQSAHWAQQLGRAAWWLWGDLPEELRQGIRRVVGHEADRIARGTPPHRIRHDTKAEENAWNSQILVAAMHLMPHDPRREPWEKAFQVWALSSFLRPADETAETVVDGRPVREQFTGANIYDDFTLENHGFVHPDYMTTFSLLLGSALDYTMAGREPPEAIFYNVAGVYENLKWFSLPDGGFVYPNGQDWRLFRNPDWTYPHVLMAVFGRDGDAWSLACRSLDTLERMQGRSESGAIYHRGEYFFASTQQSIFRALSLAWLSLQVAEDVPQRARDRLGVRRLEDGKIILNRTRTAVHTFAWGAKVMAQCVPYRPDRIVSPHQRNAVGYVRVKGNRQVLPVEVREVKITQHADRFTADMVLDHGQRQIRAYLNYESHADGSWTMRERLVALGEVTTTEIATGLVGILNNPHWVYERGLLNHLAGERTWQAGDQISEFEVTVRCRVP